MPCLMMHALMSSLSPLLTAAGEGPHALPQTPECTDCTGLLKETAGKTSEKNNQQRQSDFIFYAPIPVFKLVYEHLNLKTFDITSVSVLWDF